MKSTAGRPTAKVYTAPDTSKQYDTVPPRLVKGESFFVRHLHRASHELGLFMVDPLERYAVIAVLLIVAFLTVYMPYSGVKFVLSLLL